MTVKEWIETDGLGGFAIGTANTVPKRRYHSLLVTAQTPPTNRISLLQSLETNIILVTQDPEAEGGKSETTHPLNFRQYHHGAISNLTFRSLSSFTSDPWPTWKFKLNS